VHGAKIQSKISYVLTSIVFTLAGVYLYFKLVVLSSVFTEIPAVLEKASHSNTILDGYVSLPFVLAVAFIPDAMKNSQIGILKALGIQNKAITISFLGNWVSNCALMYIFIGKLNYGLHGIWISKFISDSGIFIANVCLVNKQNWDTISQEFQEKRDKSNDNNYEKVKV
jgi:Na+-driven multidrug efflux pump